MAKYVCAECDKLIPDSEYHAFCPTCGKVFCRNCVEDRALEDHDCITEDDA